MGIWNWPTACVVLPYSNEVVFANWFVYWHIAVAEAFGIKERELNEY
jgi:hypothetical protein